VYLNGVRQRIYTGKEVSVGDDFYEVMMHAMEKKVALESPKADNFRVFFKTDGDNVTCNRSFAEVVDMFNEGTNIIAVCEENGVTYIMNSVFFMGTKMTFSCPVATDSGLKCLIIQFYSDERCTKYIATYGG
jgi:hypothetical protein